MNNSTNAVKIFTLILLLICAIACDNEPFEGSLVSEDPTDITPGNFSEYFGEQIDARFMGRIIDEANQPVAGVSVKVGNVTTFTDNLGVFSITDASVYEKFAYIKATKNGYINASRSLTPKEGVNLVEIMLLDMDVVATINSGEESTVNLSNGTKIVFAGDFVNSQNIAYSGQVAVVLKHLNPTSDDINKQMPGMLYAQDLSGAERVLETYGMVAVELRGASGEELELAEGSTAEITLPLAANAQNPSTTIPLWYFDEINGYWKEEGQATLQGDTYVGNVSHFSFWNWDYPYPSVYVCINLIDNNGNPLSYTPVNLYSPALNSIGTYGYTNSDGRECGLVPQGDQMLLTIPNYSCSSENFSTLIGPFEADQDITITVTSSEVVDSGFIGAFNNCDGEPVTNGYLEIDLSFNGETYIFPITDGVMSLYVNYCGSDTAFTLQAIDIDANQITDEVSGNFTNPITDIGTLFTCEDAPNEIDAVDDGMDGIEITSSTGAANVLNVLNNDTLNGAAVNANDITISVFTDAFIINPDGSVDVLENTPTGQYSGEYQICENADPNNCDTAVVTLFVTNTDDSTLVINAIDDGMDGIEVTNSTGATNVLNVLNNDTLNGVAVNANDVTISVFTDAFIINPDGSVDVFENTPTGEYLGEYQICENADPNNCDTAFVTLFVTNIGDSALVIDAVDDGMDGIEVTNSTGATNVINVLDNDTLNGEVVNANNVTITDTNTNFPNNIILNADGSIDVNENTPSGTYDLSYTICENVDPNNCDTAIVTLFITNTDDSTSIIDAVDDGMDGIEVTNSLGATTVINVLDNDTLNGVAVNVNDVTITSSTNTNILINADGTVDVIESTPTGTYTAGYQICENANPNNCDTAVVTLFVTNTDSSTSEIIAVGDGTDDVSGSAQGSTVLNVLDNDTLNGVAVNANDVIITSNVGANTDYFILDADGALSMPLEYTPSDLYTFVYQICETASPNNCDNAPINVTVSNQIDGVNDALDNIDGTTTATNILNVLDNDILNGGVMINYAVTVTETSNTSGDYFTLNSNGTVDILIENVPSGTYTINYQICENFTNINNCSSASVTLLVN